MPEFEDDPIEENSLEEMLMKGFEMDDDNPNKKDYGIYDEKKSSYELSEKQRINIPYGLKDRFIKVR